MKYDNLSKSELILKIEKLELKLNRIKESNKAGPIDQHINDNEQFYEDIIDAVQEGIWVTDEHDEIIFVNRALCEIAGVSAENLKGKNLLKDFPEETNGELISHYKRAKKEKTPVWYDIKVHTPGGSDTLQNGWVIPRYKKSIFLGIICTIRDVTQQKTAEDALKTSERNYRTLLENVSAAIGYYDLDGKVILFNKLAASNMGGKPEDFVGKSVCELFDKEAGQIYLGHIRAAADTDDFPEFEARVELPGGVKWFISRFNKIHDFNGEVIGVQIISHDITEIKESQERFDLAMKASKDGLFDWNLITNEIYFSPGWKKMLGYEDDELANEFSSWESNVDPEALEITSFLHKAQISKQQEYSELEFRMKHKDGHWVDILSRFEAKFDEKGRARRVIGTHVDITERKIADNKLKASLEEKEILLRELYHRTKNNMQVISSMLGLRAMSIDNQQFTDIFKDIENKILSMALVHKKLYESGDLSHINLKEYLEELVDQLQHSLSLPSKILDIQIKGADVQVIFDTAVPFGIVINEIVTNAIKHAFPNQSSGRIEIDLDENSEKQIILNITDNGIGLPENFDIKKDSGFGLHTVLQLVESQLGGNMIMENKNGLHCMVIIQNDIYESRL